MSQSSIEVSVGEHRNTSTSGSTFDEWFIKSPGKPRKLTSLACIFGRIFTITETPNNQKEASARPKNQSTNNIKRSNRQSQLGKVPSITEYPLLLSNISPETTPPRAKTAPTPLLSNIEQELEIGFTCRAKPSRYTVKFTM